MITVSYTSIKEINDPVEAGILICIDIFHCICFQMSAVSWLRLSCVHLTLANLSWPK